MTAFMSDKVRQSLLKQAEFPKRMGVPTGSFFKLYFTLIF